MPTSSAPSSPSLSRTQRIGRLLDSCRGNTEKTIEVILGESGMWSMQREICRSVDRYRTTCVVTGNGVGKTWLLGRIALAMAIRDPHSITFVTAPTQDSLAGTMWKELLLAHKASGRADRDGVIRGLPLGGKFSGTSLTFADKWYILGHSGTSVESMSGKHAGSLNFIVDEASGVDEAKYSAGLSLNPSRVLLVGNPLRPTGKFYDTASREGTDKHLNVIRVPSTMSPHIHMERSPYGMADRTWLEASEAEYGLASIWWKAHVEAKFPTETCENVLKVEWLKLCEQAIYAPSGKTRLQIDLAGGNGGDKSVIMCRDDAGIRALEFSNLWTLEETALHAARIAREHGVEPIRVGFDKAGLGEDFAARLTSVGLGAARPYLGGAKAKNAVNMRSACARQLKWRLDPNRMARIPTGLMLPQKPFAIRKEWMELLRPELLSLRYILTDDDGSIFALEPKAAQVATLKHSPDFCDTLIASFKHSD